MRSDKPPNRAGARREKVNLEQDRMEDASARREERELARRERAREMAMRLAANRQRADRIRHEWLELADVPETLHEVFSHATPSARAMRPTLEQIMDLPTSPKLAAAADDDAKFTRRGSSTSLLRPLPAV